MKPVKVQEIHAVRDALTAKSEQEKWREQFAFVANWINALAGERARVLEIGCGSGALGGHIKARYAGIDPIRHKDLRDGVDFKIGLGENIPHPDGSFDFVLIKDAINYFSDLEPLLKDASRVLVDGGAILITEFVGPGYSPGKQKLKNFIKKYLRVHRNIWDSTYLNYYTSNDIARAARRGGLAVEYNYPRAELRYYLVLRKTSADARS
jgi:ubiquinone/menaquinone biosynthesis C-methylase UbiE